MKTKKILLAVTAIAAAASLQAQPSILYKRAFGGTWYDYATQVKATPDGGMIMTGITQSTNGDIVFTYGNGDAFVVKLKANGTQDWAKVYGGTGFDAGMSITPTSDGGFLLGGHSNSNDFDVPSTNSTMSLNFWFVKLDASGVVQWKKAYGGSALETMTDVVQLSDGNYLAAGNTRSNDGDVTNPKGLDDCWLVKLDPSGNLLWQKTFGGSGYDQVAKLIATNDGGFAFNALTSSNDSDVVGNHGGYDIWMVKGDAAGNVQWKKCYGGSGYESSRSLAQDANGNYVLVAYNASHDGDGAFTDTTDTGGCWVLKIDNSGNLQWENQYGGTVMENPAAVVADTAGNFVIAASSASNDGDVTGHHGAVGKGDYWVFCLSTAGNLLWEQSYGGTDQEDPSSIALLNDGNLAVLGSASSNNNGDVQNSNYHFGFETVHPDNSPAFNVNTSDYWVIKIAGSSATGISEMTQAEFALAPNPATESFSIAADGLLSVQVYDMQGRMIRMEEFTGQASRRAITVAGWSPGIYVVKVKTKSGVATKRLVVTE